jgi:hypothetical protein
VAWASKLLSHVAERYVDGPEANKRVASLSRSVAQRNKNTGTSSRWPHNRNPGQDVREVITGKVEHKNHPQNSEVSFNHSAPTGRI